MKSLLYAPNAVLKVPPTCTSGRQEIHATFLKDGRMYNVVLRDKIVPEDSYLVQVKAAAFSIGMREPYMGRVTPRSVRDFLIKSHTYG